MKIAIIFTGDLNNRKGKFNNIYERISYLKKIKSLEIDVFLIQYNYSWLFKKFKKVNVDLGCHAEMNGVFFNILWINLTLFEYLITHKFKLKDIACKNQLGKYVDLFENYDMLSVHDLLSSQLATLVKQKTNTPFVITWHGSDINTYPFNNQQTFKTVKFFLENTDYNFFVSKKLKTVSDKIAQTNIKSHLYSGPSENFYQKPLNEKILLKNKFNITSQFVVGFIGNLVPIKNVSVLPDIFSKIQNKISNVSFLIIGDGPLLESLQKEIKVLNIQSVLYTGKIHPEKIPDYMNVLDVLLLPSLNEGMPRVTLEAQACGVNVVGSNVGGIPEAIGEENCFVLNQTFNQNVSNKIVDMLTNNKPPKSLSDDFSWDKTIEKEMSIYKSILRDSVA